ncbi:GCN5-related N acetyltransferase [Metarhizium album ARSEF 1941]|uniref:GCN5-related N acetyltransferase n=1 Tax=Metarhizium album (strain ARSEF 1941) TaxID=1081103 RepID=A0A0B2WUB3_METAS|nr:GCN5-related N acetyltransferase [Metarhizium album ARSEF 1941]KHN96505.1 GCN5-related N acetyltransferase [Metarhizium album ARSEF 1941]
MSLPSTKAPPAQLSIRSFFQSKQPKYAPPPSSRDIMMPSNPPNSPPPSRGPPVQTLSIPPPPANLPPEAAIRLITESDIAPLRRINSLLLQVSYPDTFYHKATDASSSGPFSRVITWTHAGEEPKIIGGIVSHIESDADTSAAAAPVPPQNLYIRSLCLLSPYRSLGLMNAALDHVVATAASAPTLDVRTVTAHVWTENEEGLHWYEARGFTRLEPPVEGYYLKLRPDSAWLMKRDVGASVRSSLPRVTGNNGVAASSPPLAASTTAAVVNLPPPPPPTSGPPSAQSTPPPSAPSPRGEAARPKAVSVQSYQSQRPDTEWNDLPADMAQKLGPLRMTGSESASAASSRSSSQAPRKKKDRSYPAAAFAN